MESSGEQKKTRLQDEKSTVSIFMSFRAERTEFNKNGCVMVQYKLNTVVQKLLTKPL